MACLIIWSIIIERKFLINEASFLYRGSYIFILICTLICLYPTLHPKGFIRQISKEENLKLPLVVLSLLVAVPLFSKIFFERSLMNLLHNFSVKNKKVIYAKIKQNSAFFCHNGITLEGYSSMNGRICLKKEEQQELLNIKKIRLITKSSSFGSTVKMIEY